MRYQVFISSTYIDLVEERSAIVDSVLKLDCFPAGMELFPAANDEQFEYIKSKIDESDYYVLVIGGRYGSVDDDGISYTEKEHDYAVATKKPILVFIHSAPMNLPLGKSEIDPAKRERLEKFKKKASEKRLIKQWDSAAKLSTAVVLSLTEAFERYPGKNWVRQEGSDNRQLKDELAEYKRKLESLEKEHAALKAKERKTAMQLINNQSAFEALDEAFGELLHDSEQREAEKFFELGEEEHAMDNYEKAVELYSKAIELEPDNDEYYFSRAVALYMSGGYKDAWIDLNEAIELVPDSVWYYSYRAKALRKLGRDEEAAQDEAKASLLGQGDE